MTVLTLGAKLNIYMGQFQPGGKNQNKLVQMPLGALSQFVSTSTYLHAAISIVQLKTTLTITPLYKNMYGGSFVEPFKRLISSGS